MRIGRTDLQALCVIGLSAGVAVAATVGLTAVGDDADFANGQHIEAGQPAPERSDVVRIEAGRRVGSAMFRIRAESSVEGQSQIRVIRPGRTADRPLVFVDGVRAEVGVEEDLSPDRIDRIEVIKGAAAVERYGEEAANGVIQIFLKTPAAENPGL